MTQSPTATPRRDEIPTSPDSAPHRSLWLREALTEPRQPVAEGALRADIVIVGGGFVGLWTALRIKQHDPACDVVLLEQDVCGGGASGRNGGMVLSWWAKLTSLTRIYGREAAIDVARTSQEAIGEIGRFCEEHAIDAHFRPAGMLWTATTTAQVGAWQGVLDAAASAGVAPFSPLTPDDVAARSGSPRHLAGVLDPAAATVQPALLARGLRRVALERGVRIHEGTRVVRFSRDRPVRVTLERGTVTADRLVLATNAWAAREPELRRSLLVVSSDVIATPPIPDRLERSGWTGGESITDSQMMVNYYRTTRDHRIVFGQGTAGLSFGNVVDRRYDHDRRRTAMVREAFGYCYPDLRDVPVDAAWGGPIDRTPSSLPLLGRLGRHEHLLYGVGWSGNGVGPSAVGGHVLASLALGRDDAWSAFPLIDGPHETFPPEPLRTVGGAGVRAAVKRKERRERQGRQPRRLDDQLAKLAPAGLEDK